MIKLMKIMGDKKMKLMIKHKVIGLALLAAFFTGPRYVRINSDPKERRKRTGGG
jgi:hypothetical protein